MVIRQLQIPKASDVFNSGFQRGISFNSIPRHLVGLGRGFPQDKSFYLWLSGWGKLVLSGERGSSVLLPPLGLGKDQLQRWASDTHLGLAQGTNCCFAPEFQMALDVSLLVRAKVNNESNRIANMCWTLFRGPFKAYSRLQALFTSPASPHHVKEYYSSYISDIYLISVSWVVES